MQLEQTKHGDTNAMTPPKGEGEESTPDILCARCYSLTHYGCAAGAVSARPHLPFALLPCLARECEAGKLSSKYARQAAETQASAALGVFAEH